MSEVGEREREREEMRLKKRGYFGISAGCLYREIEIPATHAMEYCRNPLEKKKKDHQTRANECEKMIIFWALFGKKQARSDREDTLIYTGRIRHFTDGAHGGSRGSLTIRSVYGVYYRV